MKKYIITLLFCTLFCHPGIAQGLKSVSILGDSYSTFEGYVQPKRPVFPDFIVNMKDKGMTEDAPITDVVNRTIAEVSNQGGGTVVIPLSFILTMKSGKTGRFG